MTDSKKIGVTEVVLKMSSIIAATRFRYQDMEAAFKDLDNVGFGLLDTGWRNI